MRRRLLSGSQTVGQTIVVCGLSDLRFQTGASLDGNRLTGLELSKRKVKIGLTTVYLDGRETLSASRMRFCCSSGMGSFVTAILSSTLYWSRVRRLNAARASGTVTAVSYT